MSLKETLNNDFKEAMKAKDKIRKDTINFVRAAIKQTEVDTRSKWASGTLMMFTPRYRPP